MRIVLDMQSAQSGSRLGGIGRYSVELAKAMVRCAGDHDLWLVISSALPSSIADVRCAFGNLIPQDRIRVFDVHSGVAEYGNNKAKVRAAELVREDFIEGLRPDIVHVTSLFEGCLEEVVTSVGAIFPSERTAVTLYDLIPLVQREKYLADEEVLGYYLRKIENLKRAGVLLAISEFSRMEAIELLNLDPSQVVNISSAADQRFKPINVMKVDAIRIREKYKIKNRYVMYTGSFDQRKNHENLIRAFGLLPKDARADYQLLIVGNGWDAMYQRLKHIGKSAGLEDEEIVFAGHVAEEDLVPLYNLCDLFVFPSLAEGFGLPALEAMSCGTPTIGSNCTSLPEVIGFREAQFDPKKPHEIAKVMTRVLIDKNFSDKLRAHGIEHAKKFSWDSSARKAISSFESHVSKLGLPRKTSVKHNLFHRLASVPNIGSIPDATLREMSSCIALNRQQLETLNSVDSGFRSDLRVGWVSTWNTRCGIAEYSKFILEYFPAAVTVFAPSVEWTIDADGRNVRRCWSLGQTEPLSDLLQSIRSAETEVLVIQFNYAFFDFVRFNDLLESLTADGIRVFVTFHSTHDPSEGKRLSTITALSKCAGILAHTGSDIARFRELNCGHNVVFLPQGVVNKEPAALTPPFPKGHGLVVATYGFALPQKGLEEIVDAMSILRQEWKESIHLLMINAEYPSEQSRELIGELAAKISKLGLSDKITVINNYLPDEVSLGYLRMADLIVYGYQRTGESSSAAVRMGLASGVPVAVTPLPIFDDVRSAVFELPGVSPTDMAAGIRQVLSAMKTDDASAAAIGSNSILWRRAHEFRGVARYLFGMALAPSIAPTRIQSRSYTMTHNSDKLSYAASEWPLKSVVGESKLGLISTTKRAGFLLFGPFISAEQGSYCATLRGIVGADGVGLATADIVVKAGEHVLTECRIGPSVVGDELARVSFVVPNGGCEDLEVRVQVDEHSDLAISSIELMPI